MLSALPPCRLRRTWVLPSGATSASTRSPIHVCTMWTSTVAVVAALPGQPVMVIGDSTVERSGICTSVELVAAQFVGLGDGVGVGEEVGVGLDVGMGVGDAPGGLGCRLIV